MGKHLPLAAQKLLTELNPAQRQRRHLVGALSCPSRPTKQLEILFGLILHLLMLTRARWLSVKAARAHCYVV